MALIKPISSGVFKELNEITTATERQQKSNVLNTQTLPTRASRISFIFLFFFTVFSQLQREILTPTNVTTF